MKDVLGGRVLAAVMTADVCGDGGHLQTAGLDGFGGILFADEDFQEAEFGLDPLVLPVLLQHRHPVFLLNVSAVQRRKSFEFVLMKSLLHPLHESPQPNCDWKVFSEPLIVPAELLRDFISDKGVNQLSSGDIIPGSNNLTDVRDQCQTQSPNRKTNMS